jgi:hypothetical protein
MTNLGAQNRPAGSSPGGERLNTVDLMAKDTDTQTTTDTQDTSATNLPAPGGNPDNRETVQSMDAPELRNAVIELLTIIDDSDAMDVVVTISDDGTVVVEAA